MSRIIFVGLDDTDVISSLGIGRISRAERNNLFLKELGGSGDGVIGALAA